MSPGSASMVRRFVPILSWLPGYRRNWLMVDVLAGRAVWAVMVSEGMAYAGIVGVPPIIGCPTLDCLCAARHFAAAGRWPGQFLRARDRRRARPARARKGRCIVRRTVLSDGYRGRASHDIAGQDVPKGGPIVR